MLLLLDGLRGVFERTSRSPISAVHQNLGRARLVASNGPLHPDLMRVTREYHY